MKIIKVACAIIKIKEGVLVVQRGKQMKLPLKWEFPGGKIEDGETPEECIEREINEELNIKIELTGKLGHSKFNYPEFIVELIPFTANYKSGEITLAEHAQYMILDNNKLRDLDWAEADVPILTEYLSL